MRRMSKAFKVVIFTFIALLCTSLFFWKASCYRANINTAVGISSFENSRDRQFILDMFKKNWYWLVENPDFSPEFMMDKMSPDKKPENFGKEQIKVLYKDGEPVAFITYNKEKFYKGFIHFVLVDEKHRGKKYAQELIDYALKDLFSQGVNMVWLLTREGNKSARALYERMGFKYFHPYDIPGFVFFEMKKEDFEKGNKV